MNIRILLIAALIAFAGIATDGLLHETTGIGLTTEAAASTCDGWPAQKVFEKVLDECPHGPTP